MFLALILYAGYGVLDSLMFPDVKTIFWTIRYGIVCPVLLIIMDDLIRMADKALYQAKLDGRNRELFLQQFNKTQIRDI